MKINKLIFKDDEWHTLDEQESRHDVIDIVFIFGHIDILKQYKHSFLLKTIYPNADIVGCSTAGNILDTTVDEYEIVATAISFEKGYVKVFSTLLIENTITENIKKLINSIEKKDLKHLFLLAPGLINGSDIVNGIELDKNITISGGLAGDSHKFKSTYVFLNENNGDDLAIVVGFYGDSIHTAIGCETGWKEFGAKRIVTKSYKNIVYEIDNKPAIELYEKYLSDKIDSLPNSALRFPLSIKRKSNDKNEAIRVMMNINEDKSLVFAGDIEEGSIVRLMKTNVHNILNGAFLSAKKIRPYNNKPSLALTISCSARRNVLKQFSDEEIEIVQDILTSSTQVIGFYSYGEIAPFSNELSESLLHNQTMTITVIYED